jgi:HTH-type transcriptional regulator / antitoxin HigA
MEPRIIKTEEQYQRYLAEVAKLAARDPDLQSKEGGRLELLAKLIEDYEKERYKFQKPDPVEAILFRMEQQGLRQKDIAEMLGGKNRASEILAKKRALTLPMIRALYEKLNIPAELLIRAPVTEYAVSSTVREEDVPVDLVVKRGWIESSTAVSDLIQRFLAPAGSPVLLRHTLTFGANARTNRTHVWLWLSRVREVADGRSYLQGRFRREDLDEELIRYVAKLSFMEKGPRLAKEFLEEHGIAMVIEPHLPATHLDGAAMIGRSGAPIVALSLREDRLDNFWFTLIHELIHVWKHLDAEARRAIADENIEKGTDTEKIEQEANDLAAEILLPRAVWRRSEAFRNPSAKTIQALASEQKVSPAIVAGRIRHERKNYSLFSALVGYRQVRAQFPEVRWN